MTTISPTQLNVVRSLSHELKVPLLHVKGTAQLLREGVEDVELASEHMARLELSAERMLRMVDAYIYSQQIETGQLSVVLNPINIASVVHAIIANLQPLALRYNTQLALTITKSLQPAAIDRLALTHTLYGLIDAAIRTSRSEVIEVAIQHRAGNIVITIQDDGESLPTGTVKKIIKGVGSTFQPSKHLASGAGTSIYVAELLCRAMSGYVQMQHKQGKRQIVVSLPQSYQLALPL